MALLGVPADYTEDDVHAAFRREAKKAYPNVGGTAELFRQLVYRHVSIGAQGRLGQTRHLT